MAQAKVKQARDGAHDIAFENLKPNGLNAGEVYRRRLTCTRTYYRPDDMGAAANDSNFLLALGALETLALLGGSYKLAFTPGLISGVYQRSGVALVPGPPNVLGSTAADGGGYVDLDADTHWWIPSGRLFYLPSAGTPILEKTQARQHFFQPRRFVDSFGSAASVGSDPHDLLVVETADAVSNTVTASNDYRVLAPILLTDPNGSIAEARFDALGLVVGTAVYKGGNGDSFTTFTVDLNQAQIDNLYAANDPRTLAANFLGTATTRTVYDVQQFFKTRQASPADPTKWLPVFSVTIARETHESDLGAGGHSAMEIEDVDAETEVEFSATVKRAPARPRPPKAKPGTKGLGPAECRIEQPTGAAAEAAEAIAKACGCVVGSYDPQAKRKRAPMLARALRKLGYEVAITPINLATAEYGMHM